MERALPGKRELVSGAGYELLVGVCRGIEKEGLRVSEQTGMLAQTPHPRALGSALTHPQSPPTTPKPCWSYYPVSADVGLSLEQLDAIIVLQDNCRMSWCGAPACPPHCCR